MKALSGGEETDDFKVNNHPFSFPIKMIKAKMTKFFRITEAVIKMKASGASET